MNKKIIILTIVVLVIIASSIVLMLSGSEIIQNSNGSETCTNCETTTMTTISSITPTTIMTITTTTKPTIWAAITKLVKGPTGGSKTSEGSKEITNIIPKDYELEIYLIGDLSSNTEYTSVSIDGENIGDACVDTCHQCESAYELGLAHTITAEDFSNYCLDGKIEITFSDNWGVNCCCNSKHKACIDENCCEAICTSRACTNSVYFDCDDLSCKIPS